MAQQQDLIFSCESCRVFDARHQGVRSKAVDEDRDFEFTAFDREVDIASSAWDASRDTPIPPMIIPRTESAANASATARIVFPSAPATGGLLLAEGIPTLIAGFQRG